MELHVIEREGRKTVVLLDNEMRIVKPGKKAPLYGELSNEVRLMG